MKKLAIAASSVAFAAMPILGVFADSTSDTVTVTVDNGCNITTTGRTGTATITDPVAPGSSGNASSAPFTFTCNAAWTMGVAGDPLASAGKTSITTAKANDKGSQYKLKLTLAGTDAQSVTNDFNAASGNAIDGENDVTYASGITDLTVTPTYYVTIGTGGQEPGTYSGTVTYNVATN